VQLKKSKQIFKIQNLTPVNLNLRTLSSMAQIIRLSLSYQATHMGATLRFCLNNPLISHINYHHLLLRTQKDPQIYAARQLSIKSNYIAWHENKTYRK
jgi:hypothetical protein